MGVTGARNGGGYGVPSFREGYGLKGSTSWNSQAADHAVHELSWVGVWVQATAPRNWPMVVPPAHTQLALHRDGTHSGFFELAFGLGKGRVPPPHNKENR